MAYPRKLLNQGEELVLDLRPHWLALVVPTLVLVVSVVVGALVTLLVDIDALSLGALVLVVVALAYFGIKVLGWSTTNFVLTTDRLISRQGVLSKSGIEIPLERINTVFFNQSLFERMVGAGDLALESAGERGNQSFSNIRKPALVQREIYVQIEANENRKFDRLGPTGGPGLSSAEQLEKLHDLVTKGAITPTQFEAEKARIFGA